MFSKISKDRILNHLRVALVRVGYHSKPGFLIIGAQKAGTTALYYFLAEHPNIIPGIDKEIGFFAPELFEDWPEHPKHLILCRPKTSDFFDAKSYPKISAWYHSQFLLPHEIGRKGITYEATPEYLYYPAVAERIYRYDSRLKLIVILRDPVRRAFSAWNMYRTFGEGDYRPLIYAPRKEIRDFDQAVRDELCEIDSGEATLEPGYVRRGLYHEQLVRYLKLFDRHQILVLDSRELKSKTSQVLDDVIRFLGLPKFKHEEEWPPYLVGKYDTEMPHATRTLLREFYKPYNQQLFNLLNREFSWE